MLIFNLSEAFLCEAFLQPFDQVASGLRGKVHPKLHRQERTNEQVVQEEGVLFGVFQLDHHIDLLRGSQGFKAILKGSENILHYHYFVRGIVVGSFYL